MEPLKTHDVLLATAGKAARPLPSLFTAVSTDTRQLHAGALFVALKGDRYDGHQFLAQAAQAGAVAAIVDQDVGERAPLPTIRVRDSLRALLDLGALARKRLSAKVVAITGSNGKTTTKELVACCLQTRFATVKSPASFNNFVGVPHTLFLADASTQAVVLEVGTNHPGEIATLAEVARPDVAVVTNVAAAHLEGLGTIAGVLAEKGSLLDFVARGGVAVLNQDDDVSFDALRARARSRTVTTGVRRRADYLATMPHCDLDRIAFHLNGRTRVRVPLIGCHNLYNALTALAVAAELGVDLEAAATALRHFEGPPGRLKKHRVGNLLIVDDAYNANPGSMVAAIKTFASLRVPGRKILVLGDMAELGPHSKSMHREVGTATSCGPFDLLVTVGDDAVELREGAVERGFADSAAIHVRDADAAAHELLARLRPDDAILVKASRKTGLDRVVTRILTTARGASGEARGAAS